MIKLDSSLRKIFSRRYIFGAVFLALFLIVASFALDSQQVLQSVGELSPVALLIALGFVLVTQFLSATRFFVLIRPFATDMKWLLALQANMAGHLGSFVMIQLVGQMAGRQSVLLAHGLRPAALALTTLTERALVAGVGVTGFLWAVMTLFSADILADILGQAQILPLLGTALLAAMVSFHLGRSRIETVLVSRLFAPKTAMVLLGSVLMSILAWLFMLGAFVVILRTVAPQIGLMDAFAASAIVSFVAALPISINGWGVRELAAIWAFGQLGVSPADAVVTSVSVGLLATLAVLLVSPVMLLRQRTGPVVTENVTTANNTPWGQQSPDPAQEGAASLRRSPPKLADMASAWVLGLSASVLVFFQFHASFQGTLININLADPFALLAITMMALSVVAERRLPLFRARWMLPALGLCTMVILFSFARGALDFGVTSWALNNRLLGWFILMGYLAAGAFLVASTGRMGQKRLVETLLFTFSVVVLVDIATRMAIYAGLLQLPLPENVEGFSANRNAFAFAGLITLALAITLLRVEGSRLYVWGVRISIGLTMFGIWVSQSRAAWGALAVVLIYLTLTSGRTRRLTMTGLGISVLFGGFVFISPSLLDYMMFLFSQLPTKQSAGLFLYRDIVDAREGWRWDGIAFALRQWLDHPWFGGGLGSFMQALDRAIQQGLFPQDFPTIIHNSTVWLLAETGLLGALIFLLAFAGLLRLALQQGLASRDDWRQALLACLMIFGIFSLVHEVTYQRIFWLALGIVMAGHATRRRSGQAEPAADTGTLR